MTFEWLESRRPTKDGGDRRARVAAAELSHRAALLYRLGFSQKAATARLTARVAWEYDPPSKHGPHARPASLNDQAVAKIVADTYARKPG